MNPRPDQEPRFVSPLSDYGFKVTFGNQHKTLFLRQALQALLASPVPIESVSFEQTTFEGATADSRAGLYDLACTDAAGNYFLVEMQVGRFPQFLQRMKFYAFTKFNTLVKRGDFDFARLPRIYGVGILQHSIFPDLPGYHQLVNLRNAEGALLDTQLQLITVELAKFDENAPAITDLEKLLHFMKSLTKLRQLPEYPLFYREQWLREAIEELDRTTMSADERAYLEMSIAREAVVLRSQKDDVEQARAQALTEGRAEGKAEGEAKGKMEAEVALIQSMLRSGGLSLAQIAEYTGKTVAFVTEIKARLK